ncbi:thiamine pyrophosphate-dependent enzyme [Gynurincola endophyticus]|jgi:pyruvate dehydrogenase (quinone)|uniref:thiamine pyrophosphate-dependent enzyme n=1 Tax=Gynurincola endophyticus TaxID=2479004 RepID=UPI000F8DA29C|nr:thiamine pyrophosphate-dependent enzyme [Gynurincola endophyticus]
MAKKIADQLVETIEKAGIKRIYSVTGDSLNEVNDAVRRNGNIDWIHVRHEETGAFAAAAEAELNGIACCAGSSGPGHVHLINGLYEAQRSNAAVLAIASTCATDEFGVGYFQETNTIKLFDDCSGYNQIATTAKQFPRMLQAALQHAYTHSEVAVLGLPGDLTKEDAVESSSAELLLPMETVFRPNDTSIQLLADKLNNCEKITIFCGWGAGEAHHEVVQLSGLLRAPVAYSFRAKMLIQHDNPNEVGMTGLLGLSSAFYAMHDAELLLLLGTDFPYKDFMPDHLEIIQVDKRPERLGRKAKVDIGLAGDIKDTLHALIPLIQAKSSNTFLKEQLEKYDDVKDKLKTYVDDRGTENAISPEYVTDMINTYASQDAIFTVDTGMCCVWGARYLHASGQRRMLGSFTHGSMANALPQAIGAALARPGQQVVALCGDGGLSMMMGDLATIVQYKLPIKIIVYNNRSLGMVRLEMQVEGLQDWQTDMYNPDFAKVAEAMGMKSFTIEKPEQVSATIQQALQMQEPVLVNVFTNPNSLAMPPKLEFSQIKGMTKSMGKMMLNGNFKEMMDIVKSNYKHLKDLI